MSSFLLCWFLQQIPLPLVRDSFILKLDWDTPFSINQRKCIYSCLAAISPFACLLHILRLLSSGLQPAGLLSDPLHSHFECSSWEVETRMRQTFPCTSAGTYVRSEFIHMEIYGNSRVTYPFIGHSFINMEWEFTVSIDYHKIFRIYNPM